MTFSKSIFVVGMLCLALSFAPDGFSADEGVTIKFSTQQRENVTSAGLKQCPDGHTTLKDVPIHYGLIRGGADVEKQVDNLEFHLGGCIVQDQDFRPTCATCRFGYDAWCRAWARNSSDANSFHRPLSLLLKTFPTPATNHLKGKLDYSEYVRSNTIVRQSARYVSLESRDSLLRRVNEWFATHGLNPVQKEQREELNPGYPIVTSEWQTDRVQVRVQHSERMGSLWVEYSEPPTAAFVSNVVAVLTQERLAK